ncbi:class I SAM-dependent methyltransferase [Rudaea sp.]|uniref:class I SAM-dependent methyltransferase n=1 Tax=Rudaea sp. TaxID=2136325 RepID=UPI002ED6942A
MTWSYDAIADVYATDMGQSMPFDDVGWYRALCLREGGRALELGCGTGRILIELLRADVDAVGADRSLPMLARLRRDAEKYTLSPNVLQMDIAVPAVCARFRVVLLPYSLITYLRDPRIAEQCVRTLAALLEPGGCLVLDAFVPQPVTSFADFRRDYRREHEGGFLERHKRITANADGTNHIERRYTVLDGNDEVISEFVTDETIRPYAANDLSHFAQSASLVIESVVHDYDASTDTSSRFATLTARKPA